MAAGLLPLISLSVACDALAGGMVFPPNMPRKASGIYAITCLSNGKCYVGSATNLRGRLNAHLHVLRKGKHRGPRLQNAWDKHGGNAFFYEILEIVSDKALLVQREQLHIDLLGAAGVWGYNTAPHAGSMLGFKMSTATRAQMSAAHKAKGLNEALQAAARLFWRGRKHTQAALANMRAAQQGKGFPKTAHEAARVANLGHHRRHSPETRAKMAAKATGRIVSAETRAKLGTGAKGVKWTPERTAKRVATLRANREASGVRATHAKWTPERTAKFIAAFAAKREAGWKKPPNPKCRPNVTGSENAEIPG